MKTQIRRRSARLQKLRGLATSSRDEQGKDEKPKPQKAKLQKKMDSTANAAKKPTNNTTQTKTVDKACLPRTRELEVKQESGNAVSRVMGVDEAGRGPLAGPVVAAAAIVTEDIVGIKDSKKMTKEEQREELYEMIVSSPNVSWAVAIVDAARIDEINILQATMQGMHMAASALMHSSPKHHVFDKASVKHKGCYVVKGETISDGEKSSSKTENKATTFFALVDGNRVPEDMPCEAEAMIKGDSREYSIAAASILAKVTRDRLMRDYDIMYPAYQLGKHKGYPTALHMAAVRTHGASPIHRRTFAPLKYMAFDKDGRVVEED